MTTLTILLVDDEAIERQVIEKMLRKKADETDDFTFIQAKNGQEAISACKAHDVDLIFMDISMPEMDGLEATRQITTLVDTIDIIMISAYDTFDYAKQAIAYGVKAYLLKPASEPEVFEVFDRVIEAREVKHTQEEAVKRLADRSVFIEALVGDTPEEFTDDVAIGLVSASTKDVLLDKHHKDDRIMIGPVFGAHIPLAITGVKSTDEAKDVLKAICLKEPMIRFSMGGLKPAEALRESYEEALLSFYDLIDRPDISYSVYKASSRVDLKDLDAAQRKLVRAFETCDIVQLSETYTRYAQTLSHVTQHQLPKMKRYLGVLLEQLTHVGIVESLLPLQQQMELVTNQTALFTLVKDFLAKQCESIKQKHRQASPVEQAVLYVDDNFTSSDLSLEQLAEEVELSLYHLSKAFKKQTGQSFVDYLRDKRLSYAKTLLRAGDLPLKTIAYEVGFTDPNYFSRLFKKETGQPPSKFISKDVNDD